MIRTGGPQWMRFDESLPGAHATVYVRVGGGAIELVRFVRVTDGRRSVQVWRLASMEMLTLPASDEWDHDVETAYGPRGTA